MWKCPSHAPQRRAAENCFSASSPMKISIAWIPETFSCTRTCGVARYANGNGIANSDVPPNPAATRDSIAVNTSERSRWYTFAMIPRAESSDPNEVSNVHRRLWALRTQVHLSRRLSGPPGPKQPLQFLADLLLLQHRGVSRNDLRGRAIHHRHGPFLPIQDATGAF